MILYFNCCLHISFILHRQVLFGCVLPVSVFSHTFVPQAPVHWKGVKNIVSNLFSYLCWYHTKRVEGQCWKFLSPGRPRRSGLGLGDLFPEVGSPGWWPEIAISQLLWGLQCSMTTQFAVQRAVWTHYKHDILGLPINYLIKLSFCVHQGYQFLLRDTWFSSQVARRTTARL